MLVRIQSLRLTSALAIVACCTWTAAAQVTVRVGDVTALKGQSVNRLIGQGLVVGLNGTGDGDQYAVTMRALAQTLGKLGAPINSLVELKNTKNVAIVLVDAVIPENGVREGDRIDVHVSALGGASSLAGGRLLVTPMVYEDPGVDRVFAFAAGPIQLTDADVPTVGHVSRGASVYEDVLVAFAASGAALPFASQWIQPSEKYVTLVLDDAHAGWGLATAIAEAVNAELSLAAEAERVALAVDPKNVVVWLPPFQRSDPAPWIRDIQELSVLMPPTEARVTIDRATGTIAVSGDARISPVIVSQKGMTVVVQSPQPADPSPFETRRFVALDTDRAQNANVADLLQALNQLNVPIDDRISVLTQIQRAGKLHARMVFRD